ncbi:Spore coat protein U (SCPU) domain-containing protein [Enterobacterales bacterium 8AC]|nr:Spore coat protein U (SCPU) domain-containing protein [Enterobacterales bacterium 8AC]
MQFKKLAVTALFASGALLMGHSASAVKLDNSFNVKLAINSLCTIETVDDVDFGQVDSSTGTQTKSTQLKIKCNDEKPYKVALKPSDNNPAGQGKMASPDTVDTIVYNLYQDAAGAVPWGSTGTNEVSQTGTGSVQTLPVYVKVNGSEFNKPAGHYNDVVAVSINY